jgi:hypothetical protein
MTTGDLSGGEVRRRIEALEAYMYGVREPYERAGLLEDFARLRDKVTELVKQVESLSDSRKFWITLAGVSVSALTGLASLLTAAVSIILQLRGGLP